MENPNRVTVLAGIIAIIVLGGLLFYAKQEESAPGVYDGFAQCLKDKGAIFYGAFWCPHCQNQKNMFGSSKRLLPYVECSTPDRHLTEMCKQNRIESFPTWVFPDLSTTTGEVKLAVLSEKTGCPLPPEK